NISLLSKTRPKHVPRRHQHPRQATVASRHRLDLYTVHNTVFITWCDQSHLVARFGQSATLFVKDAIIVWTVDGSQVDHSNRLSIDLIYRFALHFDCLSRFQISTNRKDNAMVDPLTARPKAACSSRRRLLLKLQPADKVKATWPHCGMCLPLFDS